MVMNDGIMIKTSDTRNYIRSMKISVNVRPAKAGIQGLTEKSGFRIKSGMTIYAFSLL